MSKLVPDHACGVHTRSQKRTALTSPLSLALHHPMIPLHCPTRIGWGSIRQFQSTTFAVTFCFPRFCFGFICKLYIRWFSCRCWYRVFHHLHTWYQWLRAQYIYRRSSADPYRYCQWPEHCWHRLCQLDLPWH